MRLGRWARSIGYISTSGCSARSGCFTSRLFSHLPHQSDPDCDGGAQFGLWKATELKTVDMARFLLQAGNPDYLNVAMGNDSPLPDQPLLDRGKTVFAENCARCHSSKLPDQVVGINRRTATARTAWDRTTSPAGMNTGLGPEPTASSGRWWRSSKTPTF